MESEDRRMTFIVVPHGGRDLSTRSFEVSYRRLKAAGLVVLALAFGWAGMAASWAYVGSQAARVPGMQREIGRLEQELAQVQDLAMALRRLEGQYTQVRDMLGANRPDNPGSVWLPAIGEAPVTDAAAAGEENGAPTAWPLTQRSFVTQEHLGRIPGQHAGIDIAVAEGSYIRAAGSGVVLESGEDDVYGKFVRIR
ncbi:MAG TPA: M23 family metallopeptidase, partial [Longimicrobiaceae bacterium]|nr:M23 family metallopeptidase [Longimicrobiaceae bacterium]